jgi:redox-regulated HSP33 family molecular chaperone
MSSDYECPQERLAKELLPAVQALISRTFAGYSVIAADTQNLTASAIFVVYEGDLPVAKIIVPATASIKVRDGQPLGMTDINWYSLAVIDETKLSACTLV